MHHVKARNALHQQVDDERPDIPHADILDPDDPAYTDIVRALVDIGLELGHQGGPLDEAAAQVAVRIGRARYERSQHPPTEHVPRLLGAAHREHDTTTSVVYYIRRGAMVKIGTTQNLHARMSALRPDEVLAVEPGSYDREAEMHRRFIALRVPGQRERFYAGPALQQHVQEVRETHGPPPNDLPVLPPADGILSTCVPPSPTYTLRPGASTGSPARSAPGSTAANSPTAATTDTGASSSN